MIFEKKGSPLCITKQTSDTTNDRCWSGSSTTTPKRKEREKGKETNADNGGSTKTRSLVTAASTGDRPPSSEAPKRRYQSTPPRRKATMTTLLPRVSPIHGEERGRVASTPFRKVRRHPQAPPRRCRPSRQGFPPIPTRTSGAPEPATKPTTTQRQHGQEAPTLSHHGTAKMVCTTKTRSRD